MPTINAQYGQGNRPWYDGLRKAQSIVDNFTASFEMRYDVDNEENVILDPQDGSILRWNDSSVNGRDLVANDNIEFGDTINGIKLFQVGPSFGWFSPEELFSITVNECIVVYVGKETPGGGNSLYDYRKANDSSASTIVMRRDTHFLRDENGNNILLDTAPDPANDVTSVNVFTTRITLSENFTNKRFARSYFGTQEVDSQDNWGDSGTPMDLGRLRIGAGFGGSPTNSQIGEFLFFDVDITDEELSDVILFLQGKYGITPNPINDLA